MPGSKTSAGWSKLCHKIPFGLLSDFQYRTDKQSTARRLQQQDLWDLYATSCSQTRRRVGSQLNCLFEVFLRNCREDCPDYRSILLFLGIVWTRFPNTNQYHLWRDRVRRLNSGTQFSHFFFWLSSFHTYSRKKKNTNPIPLYIICSGYHYLSRLQWWHKLRFLRRS